MVILVIGELCIDKFIYGDVNRLCPEAPVPVLNPVETKENKGMSGNVVENLKSLYDDIDIVHWYQSNEITKTRFVDKKTNQMLLRVDNEPSQISPLSPLSSEDYETISKSDIVIISDYNKGYLSNSDIINISKAAKFSILDSKRSLFWETIENIDFVKLNINEYYNNKELVDSHVEKFLITKGEKGVTFNGKDYFSPDPQETIDVSGAGDTFTSSFSLKYYLTNDIDESIQYANEVCANVVNKKGVSLPDKKFKLNLG